MLNPHCACMNWRAALSSKHTHIALQWAWKCMLICHLDTRKSSITILLRDWPWELLNQADLCVCVFFSETSWWRHVKRRPSSSLIRSPPSRSIWCETPTTTALTALNFSTIECLPRAVTTRRWHCGTFATCARKSEVYRVTRTGWRTLSTPVRTICWWRRVLMGQSTRGTSIRIPSRASCITKSFIRPVWCVVACRPTLQSSLSALRVATWLSYTIWTCRHWQRTWMDLRWVFRPVFFHQSSPEDDLFRYQNGFFKSKPQFVF